MKAPFNDPTLKKIMELSGIKELNPVQKKAIESGLLEEKSIVVASPTASGKTLIAEIAAIKTIMELRKKAVYLSPLVALANEKYESFKKKYEPVGIKVALSVGDFDSSDPWLKDYDLIICSNEKMDSLLRHKIDWVKDIGLVIIDEIHIINDHSRGPTLEILIAKLREICKARFVALSATIKNVEEIASWLEAKHVCSEWRPVKLYEGLAFDGKIKFEERVEKIGEMQNDVAIAKNTLNMKKQAIFFVATRKSTESLALQLSEEVAPLLDEKERKELANLSESILNALETPTEQCKKLSACIKNGVAFHHAGLVGKQKSLIEENFRKGIIKFIVATPTLAMGVSLPAFRVVIRDSKRYYPRLGSVYIPVLEYKQMAGRAGRPEWDKYGESIIVAKNEREVEEFEERYINGETEEIYSKLAVEPVLRTQVLALIAAGLCSTEKELYDFFAKTLYAYQYEDVTRINLKIKEILSMLANWKMIKPYESSEKFSEFFERADALLKSAEESRLEPTVLGRRVSELYIDPKTAWHLICCMKMERTVKPISILQMISSTLELSPPLPIRQNEFDDITEELEKNKEFLLTKVPSEWDDDFEDFLGNFKTALMLNCWINEGTEEDILQQFKVSPGELRSRLDLADWLLYSSHEIATIIDKRAFAIELKKIRTRLKFGVREELLPLVKLKGIGKVKARRLYNAGIKNASHINKVPIEKLKEVLGSKTAEKIRKGLEESET